MNRDLYAVLVTSSNGITPRVSRNDTHSLVSDVVRSLIAVNDQPMTPEDMHLKAIPEDMTLYEMFSWDQQCIPSKARVGQIPKPGVFFVVVPMLNGQEGGIYALMLLVKQHLSRDDGPAKFQRHIAGPWAHWSPQPLSTFDVLISASDVDDAVAIDIETRLAESGLSTERSVRPSTAELGDESLRRRLLECQIFDGPCQCGDHGRVCAPSPGRAPGQVRAGAGGTGVSAPAVVTLRRQGTPGPAGGLRRGGRTATARPGGLPQGRPGQRQRPSTSALICAGSRFTAVWSSTSTHCRAAIDGGSSALASPDSTATNGLVSTQQAPASIATREVPQDQQIDAGNGQLLH
ncbi:hypothetical protein ABIA70_002293 [Arthrobacter sp. 754]